MPCSPIVSEAYGTPTRYKVIETLSIIDTTIDNALGSDRMRLTCTPKAGMKLFRKAIVIFIASIISTAALSSCIKPPESTSGDKQTVGVDIDPVEYDLAAYVSPDGDWKCWLPCEPQQMEDTELPHFIDGVRTTVWEAQYYDTSVFIARITGKGLAELKALSQGGGRAYLEKLRASCAVLAAEGTSYRPIFDEEELKTFILPDKPTPTHVFKVPCEMIRGFDTEQEIMKANWCGLGTYSDKAFYLVAIVCGTESKVNAICEAFEVIPDAVFEEADTAPSQELPNGAIQWQEAYQHVGETATVYGTVADIEYAGASDGQPTFIDLGAAYPDPNRVTIVIWGEYRNNFPELPEIMYEGKTLCVTGEIYLYRGVCNIMIASPSQVQVLQRNEN